MDCASDLDVVYFWRATGERYNGKQVYKIGETSLRIRDRRIQTVASGNDMQYELLAYVHVGKGKSSALERYLLDNFGENPKLDVPDGRTEFRALTDDEARQVVAIMHAHFVL